MFIQYVSQFNARHQRTGTLWEGRYKSCLTALGTDTAERGNAYKTLLRQALSDDELHAIRAYLQQQRVLGHDAFKAMVEAKTHRFAGIRPPHRPPRRK